MRHLLAHDEIRCGLLRPRRPILCGIHVVGFAVNLTLLLMYPFKPMVAVLPITILLQYVVSGLSHWLADSLLRRKIDHVMIAILIAATFVPFWGTKLPVSEMQWRLPLLSVLTFVTCVLNAYPPWRKAGAMFYLVLGAFGLVTSFNELQVWLPPFALREFWVGVGLYSLQFAIVMGEKLDLHPGLFGYREIQHVILLIATTLHTLVVMQNL